MANGFHIFNSEGKRRGVARHHYVVVGSAPLYAKVNYMTGHRAAGYDLHNGFTYRSVTHRKQQQWDMELDCSEVSWPLPAINTFRCSVELRILLKWKS